MHHHICLRTCLATLCVVLAGLELPGSHLSASVPSPTRPSAEIKCAQLCLASVIHLSPSPTPRVYVFPGAHMPQLQVQVGGQPRVLFPFHRV